MAVSYKPTSSIISNFADNQCRWDRTSAPHYEVWFLTLNHCASQQGFWFRYVLHSPSGQIELKPHAVQPPLERDDGL